ncbi:RNA-binding domain-containing protein [Fistulina hepatica ATCC 64428]|uniref:RNA-binding domain-containing protein n=1 Tax=Fistulina hepatica ATCC 64428 TaxID=1128425 RepID=A0A0D7AK33_9AGAR|nr:RNA-binding domain-containing protein [Fistulina hepatica ATCC 64428]
MDEEYVKQVCGLMGWDPIQIKVPQPVPDPAFSQQPNNAGYCLLTFPTPAQAASVLAQVNNPPGSPAAAAAPAPPMPNSAKPFVMNWATAVPPPLPAPHNFAATNPQAYSKEYSIFVGDLAPETSNSDLVAVFRNPVLGLRNDREPKFIRPFLSCKSAKIMLDPVTGVSRGYGFVRFTDEADQQRALIEMHGLYCLSRPMRISPATANTSAMSATSTTPGLSIAVDQPRSISDPLASQRLMPEESWKHQAQARAILGNLIGPNGEQLTSTDPYNTTVFVGGLSPLINEDTLRTFFSPFGEIHYVKVPVGKHCGFVQFVRKADAERAIARMQGFQIGGSRIRLSWGRSQYKAAQAAAQAAQAATLQAQYGSSAASSHYLANTAPQYLLDTPLASMTPEQAIQLLQRFYLNQNTNQQPSTSLDQMTAIQTTLGQMTAASTLGQPSALGQSSALRQPTALGQSSMATMPTFSPFSPDPNPASIASRVDSSTFARPESGAFSARLESLQSNKTYTSASRYTSYLDNVGASAYLENSPPSLQVNRAPVSRPSSGALPSVAATAGKDGNGHEYDALQDVNGTLASLDLDSWKAPGAGDGSESSSTASVQFRVGPTSSP